MTAQVEVFQMSDSGGFAAIAHKKSKSSSLLTENWLNSDFTDLWVGGGAKTAGCCFGSFALPNLYKGCLPRVQTSHRLSDQ